MTFFVLVGWGEGCIASELRRQQNISAVDGFLYKDSSGETHYQRLGSCLEYFLDSTKQSFPYSSVTAAESSMPLTTVLTKNGVDINFNDQTVMTNDGPQHLNRLFSNSKAMINDISKDVVNKNKKVARDRGQTPGFGWANGTQGCGHSHGPGEICHKSSTKPIISSRRVRESEAKVKNGRNSRDLRRPSEGSGVYLPSVATRRLGLDFGCGHDHRGCNHTHVPEQKNAVPSKANMMGFSRLERDSNVGQAQYYCAGHVSEQKSNISQTEAVGTSTRLASGPRLGHSQHCCTGNAPEKTSSMSLGGNGTIGNSLKPDFDLTHRQPHCTHSHTIGQRHPEVYTPEPDSPINSTELEPCCHGGHASSATERGTVYRLKEQAHDDHVHFKLAYKKIETTSCKNTIGKDEEGCPCCNAGLDFDEFASVVKMMNASDETEKLQSLAEFSDGGHWGIFFGVALPFAAIGLTAAIRNIKGSYSNQKKVDTLIKGLEQDIRDKKLELESVSIDQRQELETLIKNLEAFKKTLKYSKFDSEFNLVVPGVINGAASSLVLASGIWHQPFALPFIAAYALGQTGRNTYDLKRVWDRHLIEKKFEPSVGKLNRLDRINIGTKKVNQIGQSKRRFFSSNGFNFAVFTAGALLTFLSLPALALGIGAAGLPVGLTLLGYGALTTGIANNIWPTLFKPRNGDLGINRLTLNKEKCLEEIGKRRAYKNILKLNRKKHVRADRFKQFGYQVLTAFPDKPSWLPKCIPWPFGNKGQQLLHKNNKERFKKAQVDLSRSRHHVLNQLLNINGDDMMSSSNLESQWNACKALGFDVGIMNLLIDEKSSDSNGHQSNMSLPEHGENHGMDIVHGHHHDHGPHHDHGQCHDHTHSHGQGREVTHESCASGCCGHDKGSFLNKLKSMRFFDVLDSGDIKLKEFQDLTGVQQRDLAQTIDDYLHFELIETLRYEERGLDDFFWQI